MPKPPAKGGKPAPKDYKSLIREASTAANNNPQLRKFRITSIGEWNDTLQAFVIHVDMGPSNCSRDSTETTALIPDGSAFLSSKKNLHTSTGHPSGPTLIKVGDFALCSKTVTPVTTEEPKWVKGLGHVTARYVHDEITWVLEGLFDPSLRSPPAGSAGGGP